MKKFKKGAQIKSLGVLVKELAAGKYVFLYRKPQHHGWVLSLQLRLLLQYIERKMIWKAELTEEWRKKNEHK